MIGGDGPFSAMAAPADGRTYPATRRVRLGDVTDRRQVRLDAVARYLHDIAADDVRDAGIAGKAAWVVRRTTLEVFERPHYEEVVDLFTWCSGTGAAWAERRTTVAAGGGHKVIEGSSLWVCLDPTTLRPKPLDDDFFTVYGNAARTRTVPSRLLLDPRPPDGAATIAWPLRRADRDVLGHVNNAIAFSALEEEVDRLAPGRLISQAQVEYRQAISDGRELRVTSEIYGDDARVWLADASGSSAIVAALRLARV